MINRALVPIIFGVFNLNACAPGANQGDADQVGAVEGINVPILSAKQERSTHPAYGRDKTKFMDPTVRIQNGGAFFNGNPYAMLIDGCCEGSWTLVAEQSYQLECRDGESRSLFLRYGSLRNETAEFSSIAGQKTGLTIEYNGRKVEKYGINPSPNKDGIYENASSTYSLRSFFSDVSRAQVLGYQCSGKNLNLWLDIDRELAVKGGQSVAFSRERYLLRIRSDKEFIWVVSANSTTPTERVRAGREFLYNGEPPTDCDVKFWPCSKDLRDDLVQKSIAESTQPDPN